MNLVQHILDTTDDKDLYSGLDYGFSLIRSKKFDIALNYFRQLIELSPENVGTYIGYEWAFEAISSQYEFEQQLGSFQQYSNEITLLSDEYIKSYLSYAFKQNSLAEAKSYINFNERKLYLNCQQKLLTHALEYIELADSSKESNLLKQDILSKLEIVNAKLFIRRTFLAVILTPLFALLLYFIMIYN